MGFHFIPHKRLFTFLRRSEKKRTNIEEKQKKTPPHPRFPPPPPLFLPPGRSMGIGRSRAPEPPSPRSERFGRPSPSRKGSGAACRSSGPRRRRPTTPSPLWSIPGPEVFGTGGIGRDAAGVRRSRKRWGFGVVFRGGVGKPKGCSSSFLFVESVPSFGVEFSRGSKGEPILRVRFMVGLVFFWGTKGFRFYLRTGEVLGYGGVLVQTTFTQSL